AEARLQLVEEAEVDVDLLVYRAVERPDVGGRGPAAGARRAGEEHGPRDRVVLHLVRPVRLDAVYVADDLAVLAPVRVGAGSAARRVAGDRAPVERRQTAAAAAAAEQCEGEIDEDAGDADPA